MCHGEGTQRLRWVWKADALYPAMSNQDTLGNMRTLDLWRADIGLIYDEEKADAPPNTVRGEPLYHPANSSGTMKYGRVGSIEKEVLPTI